MKSEKESNKREKERQKTETLRQKNLRADSRRRNKERWGVNHAIMIVDSEKKSKSITKAKSKRK